MSSPSISHDQDGNLRLFDLAPFFVSVLLELPELLEPDQPDEVKQRLYPEPSANPEQSSEWKKFVHPELFALIASAREIVMTDLGSLVPADEDEPLGSWQLLVPPKHVPAWLSALNAARLSLGARHAVIEEDMNEEELESDTWDEKRLAVAKIHLLGWLQQMILEDQYPPPRDAAVPDSLPPDVG